RECGGAGGGAPAGGSGRRAVVGRGWGWGMETAQGARRTAVSESQIRGLADLSSGFILWRHRSPEHPRRSRTVGFQRRITGDVVATVILKFPHLAGHPRECPTFDRREVAADKLVLP